MTDPSGNGFTHGYNTRGEMTSLTRGTSGVNHTWGYDADGSLNSELLNQPAGRVFPYYSATTLRNMTAQFNGRGAIYHTDDGVNRDTLDVTFSGLGYLATSRYTQQYLTYNYMTGISLPSRYTSKDIANTDPLGNTLTGSTADTAVFSSQVISFRNRASTYDAATGRLVQEVTAYSTRSYTYNPGGDLEYLKDDGSGSGQPSEDRLSYYAADGQLKASEWRWVSDRGNAVSSIKGTLEQYRYDVLGRRVLVWAKRACDYIGNSSAAECNASTVRRTIWDGHQELAEIQVPGLEAFEHAGRPPGAEGPERRHAQEGIGRDVEGVGEGREERALGLGVVALVVGVPLNDRPTIPPLNAPTAARP